MGVLPNTIHHSWRELTHPIEALKVNSTSESQRFGRQWAIKKRNVIASAVTKLANLYFRAAHIPIRFWSDLQTWRAWEVNCFRMLNGDRFHAFSVGQRTVCASKLPGENLWTCLERGTLNEKMIRAAGREFRRAHRMWSRTLGGRWSHGDAGLSNILYDAPDDRARLIDFEIVHDRSLSATVRQADDLLVFILDLICYAPEKDWLKLSRSFLDEYRLPGAIDELKRHLNVPSGAARIWWNVRTRGADAEQIARRLDKLRRAQLNCSSFNAR